MRAERRAQATLAGALTGPDQGRGDFGGAGLGQKRNAAFHVGREDVFGNAAVDLQSLRMRVAVLAVDARADQDRVRGDVEQRRRMRRVLRAVMRRGEDVRFERAAEQLVDRLPARILGVARDQVGEAARRRAP